MFELKEKISKEKANLKNPVVLAFVGDAVHSLFVREKLSLSTDMKTGELNKIFSSFVSAKAQCEFFSKIEGFLTEEELAVFLRARNAKKGTKSKSSTVAEYNVSTGLEAVFGYLFLTGETERLNYLLSMQGE